VMDPASHNLVYTFDGKYEDGGVAVLDSALRAVTGGTLRYTVGGVAVDPATQQLFVGRLMTDLVALERTPGQYMPFHETTVKVGVGIHHLALDPTTETLYVANASSHTVSVVDVSTGQVIATVAVGSPSTVYFSPDGPGPGAIAVDPVTHQVYVADMGGHTVTVLQGVTTAVPNAPAMPDTGAGGGRWLQQPVQAPTTTTSSPCAGSAASCLYHASIGLTQGILLADSLKAIITGPGALGALPTDVSQEAQGSPLFHQNEPSRPNWVPYQSLLSNANFTNAFAPE